jgi:hypothetical protein
MFQAMMLEGVSGFPWALACPKNIRALPYMITYLLDSILSDLTFQNRRESLNPTVPCGILLSTCVLEVRRSHSGSYSFMSN